MFTILLYPWGQPVYAHPATLSLKVTGMIKIEASPWPANTKAVVFSITGIPTDVTYETTVEDLLTLGSMNVVTRTIERLHEWEPKYIYLPESGLAAVPMKNSRRLEVAIMARFNAMLTGQLHYRKQLSGLYLSLNNDTTRLNLEVFDQTALV